MPNQEHRPQHPTESRLSEQAIEPVCHRELLSIPAWARVGDVIRHDPSGYEYTVCEGDAGTDHYFEWMELSALPDFFRLPVEVDDEVAEGHAELRIDGGEVAVTITGITTCECGEDHGTQLRSWQPVGTEEDGALDHWIGQGAGVDPAEPVEQEVAEAVGEVMDPEENQTVNYIAQLLNNPARPATPIREGETVPDAVHRILTEQMPRVYRWQQQVIARYVGIDVPGMLHTAEISELPSGIAAVARYTPPPELQSRIEIEREEWAGLPVVRRRQPDGSVLHISEAVPSGAGYIMTADQLRALAQQHLDSHPVSFFPYHDGFPLWPARDPEQHPSRRRRTHRDRREAMDRWLAGAGWHGEDSHQVESSEAHMTEKNTRAELCWASLADFTPCNSVVETEVGLCAYHAAEMRDDGEKSGVSDDGT